MQGILLDIRSYAEWNEGHFSNAIHVPTPLPPLSAEQICLLTQKLAELMNRFGPDTQFAVYCKKGKRSGLAASLLRVMGAEVKDLGGVDNEPLASIIAHKQVLNPNQILDLP